MHELAILQHAVFTSIPRQRPYETVGILLLRASAVFRKFIDSIIGPATGEIASSGFTKGTARACHENFSAVVQHRYPAQGHQHCDAGLEFLQILSNRAEKSLGIVVVHKSYMVVGTLIEVVLRQRIIKARGAFRPALLSVECLVDSKVDLKIGQPR